MKAVLLPVGQDMYAVPIEWVRQVLLAPPATTLVTAPAVVLGLFNMRGEIVPLLDTAALLGIGTIESVAYAVILGSSSGPVALAVTGLPERVTLTGPDSPSALAGTAGTYCSADRVVVLLDPGALLASSGLASSHRGVDASAAAGA
jgi:chemotaxis signal transduction protein